MALPGEAGIAFPEEYQTKVPEKVRRQEARLARAGSLPGELLSGITPRFLLHEDDRLYFDYGAVRLGRKPAPIQEATGEVAGDGAKLVCVGLGWLPGWQFGVNEAGLPDIVPINIPGGGGGGAPKTATTTTTTRTAKTGVLGLLFKLELPGPRGPTPSRRGGGGGGLSAAFGAKRPPVEADDLPRAGPRDWAAAVPFHAKLKTLRQVGVHIHVLDGGVGHRYGRDGAVVPFRTPDWTVRALVHVDPERPPVRAPKTKTKKSKAASGPEGAAGGVGLQASRRLQGEWVADELQRWIREAKLPPEYVEETLRKWIADERESHVGNGGLLKFFGFKQ